MSANVCRVKRSFKQYQNEHNSLKDTGEKGKKPCNIDPKIAMKILFYYPLPLNSSNPKILKAFLKTFPSKMKPTKCPTKEKKTDCCVIFKPKNSKVCFLRMPKLHKLIFCIWIRRLQRVCEWLCDNKVLALNSRTVTRKLSTSSKTRFSAKSPVANGLRGLWACLINPLIIKGAYYTYTKAS